MNPAVASAIDGAIGAGVNMVGQFIQRGTDRRNIEAQNRANMQLAQYTYQQDKEMWNMQNLYNSPQKQMERLKMAGLNPNLVYGNGVTGNTTSSYPRFQTPNTNAKSQSAIDLMSMLGAYQDMQIKQAQLQNLQSQRRAMDMSTALKNVELTYAPLNRFNESEIKKAQASISWLKQNLSEAEFNTLFDPDKEGTGNYIPKPLLSQWINAKYNANSVMLNKYNAEIALKNMQNDLAAMNMKFMKWGSPVWTPLINAAGGIGKALIP